MESYADKFAEVRLKQRALLTADHMPNTVARLILRIIRVLLCFHRCDRFNPPITCRIDCRSTLKVRTALLFTPCTKRFAFFSKNYLRKAGCSAARSKRGLPRPRRDARAVATACRSKGGCDKRFINKNNGNAAEQGGVATASRSKGGCDKGFMNKNNGDAAEQGGLRRRVVPPGGC